ncbi:unnamed protein product [Ectocarpus sp. CCAP 1310/34]|nr:unnamed protein product [Ectocarpus sp. CCAP 1310/34]
MVPSKPVLRCQRKGKGKGKASEGGAGAGAGAVAKRSGGAGGEGTELVGKKGDGKRQRAGQSHKRGRQEQEDEVKPVVVPPALDKLWSVTCAAHFCPIKKSDEDFLRDKQLEILANFGVAPGTMRKRAEEFEGTFLHPTMGPEDIGRVLDEEKSEELKLGLVPALGRPYEDLWAEESYVESLASRSWSSLGRDSSQHADASTSAAATAAGAGTNAGADAGAAKAGGGGGSSEGERRSLRAGGRRSSGGGFGSFSGAAALLLHGSSSLAGGDGGADGADAVVGPCLPMSRDWTEVVPSHDEASFRRCLAESRSRGGIVAGRKGFYLQRGGDIDWEAEELEREKERRRAAAGLEAPPPPGLGKKGADGSSRSRSLPGTKSTTRTPSGSLVEVDEGVIVAKAFRSRGEKDRAAAAAAAAHNTTKNAPQESRPPRKAKRCAAAHAEIGADPGAVPAVGACSSRAGAGAPECSPGVGCGGSSPAAGTPRAAWPAKDGNCAMTSGVDGGAVAVTMRTSVRLRGGAAAAATAEPPPTATAAAVSGGQGHRQEEEEQEEEQEEDIDEVSWELRRLARDEVKVNAKNLYVLSELGAYCRQERKVYQSVFDRDEWAKDVLSNALRLSEVGKTVDLKGKRAKPRGVGLADDFPYHDPTQLPVLEALRKQTVAYQHHQRNQEEMGGFGLAEIEQERARREKAANEATAVAEAKMKQPTKDWEHARLAVGRKGQTGRGRGIPIPGGVAHPFLLDKKTADFLYSVGTGDEVEVKDEWDVWCRAKVVAVRGEGGWDPKTDTNVLRAVKVSFEGSGPAMDAWCSIDGGMVAQPGTHLPLSKRQRALTTRKASVAAAAAAAAASARAGAKPIRIRAFHRPRPPPGMDSTSAVSSNGAANGSASADCGKAPVQGGAAAASAKRKRTGSSDDRRQGKRPAADGEGFGGVAGYVDGETAAVAAAATGGMVPRCALRARAGIDSGNESSSSISSDSSSSSGYNEVNATGRPRKTAASFRQARRTSGSSGSSGSGGVGGSGAGGLDTIATRFRGTGDGGGSVKAVSPGEAVSKEAGMTGDRRVGRRGRGGAVVQQRKTARNGAHHHSSNHYFPSDPLSSRRTMPLGRGPSPPGDVVVPNGSVPAAVVAASPSPSSPSPFGRRSSGRVAGLSNGTGVGGGTAKDLRSVNSGGGGESGVNTSKGGASVSAAAAAAAAAAGLSTPAPGLSSFSTPPLSTATTSAAAAAAAAASAAANGSPRTPGPWASAVTTTLTSWSATALGRISPTLTNRFVAAGTSPAATPATAAAGASAARLTDSNNGAVGGGHNAGQPGIGELANDAAVVGSNVVPPSCCDALGGGVKANPHSGAGVAATNGQAAICSTLAPRDAAAVPTTAAAAAAAPVVGASPTPSGFAANVRASATNGLKVVFRRS